MAFATLEQLKTQLNKDLSVTDDDAELQLHLDATEVVMTHLCGASASTSYTETTAATRSGKLLLDRSPVLSVASVTPIEGALSVALADVVIENDYGILRAARGMRFVGWYQVVYAAGAAAVAANQLLAALMIAQHLWEVQNGRGGPRRDDVVVVAGFAIPNRAIELLQPDPTPATLPGIA